MLEIIDPNLCLQANHYPSQVYDIPRQMAPALLAFGMSRRFDLIENTCQKTTTAFLSALPQKCARQIKTSIRNGKNYFCSKLTAKESPYFLLSIDGGGVKGVIPAKILKLLEEKVGYKTGQLFDGIAGTSTGSILAASLSLEDSKNPGQSKYSAEDIHEIYHAHSAKIFTSNLLQKLQSLGGLHGPRYPNKQLFETAEAYLNDAGLQHTTTDLIIPCIDVETRKLHLFKHLKKDPCKLKHPLSEILKAACAAPTYFPAGHFFDPDEKRKRTLVDAGIALQNPCYLAFDHFCKDLPKDRKIVVLSLGTGRLSTPLMNIDAVKYAGAIKWLSPIIEMLLDSSCDAVDQQMKIVQKYDKRVEYIRLEVKLETQAQKATDNTEEKNLLRLTELAKKTWEEQHELEEKLINPLKDKMRRKKS